MLVLSRRAGERINIDSCITITVIEVKGNRVRIGIQAPEDVPVIRAELNDFLTLPVDKFQANGQYLREGRS
jgi:carbon storage regulator